MVPNNHAKGKQMLKLSAFHFSILRGPTQIDGITTQAGVPKDHSSISIHYEQVREITKQNFFHLLWLDNYNKHWPEQVHWECQLLEWWPSQGETCTDYRWSKINMCPSQRGVIKGTFNSDGSNWIGGRNCSILTNISKLIKSTRTNHIVLKM